ncbi:HpcH/HpaI aldolase/citrate lyase family protein [Desulfallas thermosapovorans]|uniref:Citrate lyase subunit beta/citryl-CoA lyase n=1 Tax=Desulfallas thermosapovorans DSM 6562 TaxID=1121431 RepID=A0A5S4ZW18_9FIRM|nr:CoA ester lyase [Desulfallas thermosapovorans]TYO97218.1 citrate lyase subunit beta/citryl-CoA lyase [Desulfallas thermosapovorans DSM 6562]
MGLLRCLLFVPGTDRKKINKAFALNADAVIMDLEDAVAISEKHTARRVVSETINSSALPVTYVRVNAVSSPYILADLQAVVQQRLAGIMLAKAETAEEVRRADWLMGLLEEERNIPRGTLELVPFIESARGIENAGEVAAACPRVKRLAFGGNDYTADTWTTYSEDGSELFYARAKLIAASRMAGIEPPLDTVCPFIKNIDALRKDAHRARKLGFQGKMVIHPAQIEPVKEIFSPTPEEVAAAEKIVAAFDEAEAKGTGVIQLDGKMVEYPIANRARQILAAARELK